MKATKKIKEGKNRNIAKNQKRLKTNNLIVCALNNLFKAKK